MSEQAQTAYGNVEERFLPPPAYRPTLTFGAPQLHYAWSPTLNAGTTLLDGALRTVGPDKVAVVQVSGAGAPRNVTYGELARAVNDLTAGMQRLGIRRGDRVLTRIGETIDMAIAQLATWAAGAVIVPTAPIEGPSELAFILRDTEARLMIIDPVSLISLDPLRAQCPQLQWIVATGGVAPPGADATTADLSNRSGDSEPVATRPLDVSGIYYTGGTTGRPKGCIHTHAGELAVADLSLEARGDGADAVLLCHGPLGHAFGNGEKITFPFRAGATAVYRDRPSAAEMWSLLIEHRVTTLAANATMYRMMLRDAPDRDVLAGRLALRTSMSSGEILDEPTATNWRQLVGVDLRNAVGMTPLRHVFADSMIRGRHVAPGLSVGVPLPGFEARLVAVDDPSRPVAPGEVGRLAVRGPTGIAYWHNVHPGVRERNHADVVDGWSLLDDGYLRDTDGWLWFAGRLDDMIVTGGRQVAPREVEEVLATHPTVAEVAVAAAPDPVRGFAVAAFVRVAPGAVPGDDLAAELQQHVRSTLAGYKYPRLVLFIDELPKDHLGKINRRKLRAQLTAGPEQPTGEHAATEMTR